ncbi:hypothetical protein DM02DRAFT_304719 [Periconia macrospinosa]|uniref:Uncharacterized protein n=1 Tax=Periconia macrospinosa TaxID=97972 RepID=A0A2V1DX85_9PLEO|nr:hypothetical protein DM02DRAFT_304719 [Periconia macrospinosa]
MDIPLRTLASKPSQPSTRFRDLLTPGGKDKPTPELRQALSLLHIRDLEGLENHFLALEAFLKPWSHYRDTYLLVRSQVAAAADTTDPTASTIRKADILWFYTHFMHGELRYDARADQNSDSFTHDETQYGRFDQSHWTQAEYEKQLYAWLLQEFKVGKGRNPYGFRYFELQNVCSAWENVFLPIVTAVRDSYDIQGRKHYGRLATFVEDRAPSRLAFPGIGNGGLSGSRSATMPTRVMSFSKQGHRISGSPPKSQVDLAPVHEQETVTNRELDEVDAELRNITEKYGGVVERPKFKKNMKDWLTAQKERSKQKKAARVESPMFGCQGIDEAEAAEAATQLTIAHNAISYESLGDDRSPISPVFPPPIVSSDSDVGAKDKGKKKMLKLGPFGMYGYTDADAGKPLKSPDHGVTRVLDIPDASPSASEKTPAQNVATEDEQPWTKPAPAFANPKLQHKSSDGLLYTAIRNSNPFAEENNLALRDDASSIYSTMSPQSAIPEPLFKNAIRSNENSIEPASVTTDEVNGYELVPSSSFVVQRMRDRLIQVQKLQQDIQSDLMHSQLSRSLVSAPSLNRARFATQSAESEHTASLNAGSPRASLRSPTHSSLDDENNSLYDGPAPPIPAKNPRRSQTVRMSTSSNSSNPSSPSSPTRSPFRNTPLARSSTVHGGQTKVVAPSSSISPIMHERIVSRENIRAHLALSTHGVGYNDSEDGENLPGMAGSVDRTEHSHPEGSPDVQRQGHVLEDKIHGDDSGAGAGAGVGVNDTGISPTNFSQPFYTYNKHFFPRKDRGQGSPNVSAEYKF